MQLLNENDPDFVNTRFLNNIRGSSLFSSLPLPLKIELTDFNLKSIQDSLSIIYPWTYKENVMKDFQPSEPYIEEILNN